MPKSLFMKPKDRREKTSGKKKKICITLRRAKRRQRKMVAAADRVWQGAINATRNRQSTGHMARIN